MCINILCAYALLAHTNDTYIIASLSLSLCRSPVWKIWNSNVYTFYAITECLFLFTIYALNFCCCFFPLSNRFHFRKLHQTVLIGVFMWILCSSSSFCCLFFWMNSTWNLWSREILDQRIVFGSALIKTNKRYICMHGQVAFYLTFKKEKERKIEKSKNVWKKSIQMSIHFETINRNDDIQCVYVCSLRVNRNSRIIIIFVYVRVCSCVCVNGNN